MVALLWLWLWLLIVPMVLCLLDLFGWVVVLLLLLLWLLLSVEGLKNEDRALFMVKDPLLWVIVCLCVSEMGVSELSEMGVREMDVYPYIYVQQRCISSRLR